MESEDELRDKISTLQCQLAEAEKKISRARNRDNLARQAANIAYWDFTPATGYLQWSPEMLPLISGLQSGELDTTYENFTKYVHRDDLDEVDKIVANATEKRIPFSVVYRVEHTDGSEHWLMGWGGTVGDNDGMQRMIGAVMDITEQKETEKALVNTKKEAEKANKAKSKFLSAMSHELRTPLNAILGFGQLLKCDVDSELDNQKSDIDEILNAGKHLLELINEILDLSRIESGTIALNIEDVSITDLLKASQSLVPNPTSEHGIEISITSENNDSLYVRVDFSRFKQILINLISNAIKYNRRNGKVVISSEETTDNMLRISVTDTGYGIPNHKINELFKPFSRLGAEESGIEGTGIGLVVCKDLIGLMGGTIGVHSEVGTGSIFWVDIPLAKNNDGNPVEKIENSPAFKRPITKIKGRLLYVEDAQTNVRLMESIVSKIEGLTITTSFTGQQGIEQALLTKPDIIILDINLPDMSGLEVLKEIRRHSETQNIPTLAMSAAATKRDIDQGLDAGFLQYLTKPIQVSEVVEAISAAMRGSSDERSD